MPKMTIEEAGQLGLLSPEELAAIGFNPFTPRQGASWSPQLSIKPGLTSKSFFRYPSLYQRPGISNLRFGLGGLGQGLTLSPESPALGLSGVAAPVGRRPAASRAAGYGVAGGVAGGRAGIGSEGSGNLPTMILPDGRRLVRLPDGRTMIVGGNSPPIQADAPDGLAALQAMGLIQSGLGAAQSAAALINQVGLGTPGGVPGGIPGGEPGGEPAVPGAESLIRPASLELPPGADIPAPAAALPGLVPQTQEEAAFLEANLGAPPGGGGPSPEFLRSLLEAPSAPSGVISPGEMMPGAGGAPGYVPQEGPWTGQPEMFPGGIGGPGDLSLGPSFYAPGGGDAASMLLDPETRRLYDLGLVTPEDIMAMMPAPIAGRADTAPRGLGPSPNDIFAREPAPEPGAGGGGFDTNFTLGNTLGLGQSLLGIGQGAIGAGITGDPSQLIGALIKSGMSVNQIAKIPGLNQAGISAGLGGALGILNMVQAARAGNVPGAIGGGLSTVGGAAQFAAGTPAIAGALGGSTALNAVGAGAGGLGGLLSLAQGVQGLIKGGAPPLQSALQLAGGLTSTYSALVSLSQLYPSLFGGSALPPISQVFSTIAPQVAANLGIGPLASAAAGFGPGAASELASAAAPSVAAALTGGSVAPAAAAAASSAAPAIGSAASAGITGLFTLPFMGGSLEPLLYMGETAEQARRAAGKAQQLTGGIGDAVKAWQRAPELLGQLNAGTTPEDALRINQELRAIQDQFQASGMENFLKMGSTMSQYSGGGKRVYVPGVTEIMEKLEPMMSAYTLGLLRSQDIAQRAGLDVPRAISPDQWASTFGGRMVNFNLPSQNPLLNEPTWRSGEGDPVWAGITQARASGRNIGFDVENPESPLNTEFSPWLSANYLPAASQPRYMPSQDPDFPGFRVVNPSWDPAEWTVEQGPGEAGDIPNAPWSNTARAAFAAFTPGSYEQQLARLIGTPVNPLYQQFGFGTVPSGPPPASPAGGPTTFNPLAFLSSLGQGERVNVRAGQDTLTFIPYRPEQSSQFADPAAGYEQIGEGFYAKSSGQGGTEVYLPQDRSQDLGKALSGYTASPVSGQLASALAVPAGQEAGATPGAGPASDIAPSPVPAGTAASIDQTQINPAIASATGAQPAGFREGGVVPETGRYLVHKGEVVIPADKADTTAESDQFLEEMRKRGDLVGGIRMAQAQTDGKAGDTRTQAQREQDERDYQEAMGKKPARPPSKPLPPGEKQLMDAEQGKPVRPGGYFKVPGRGSQAPAEPRWYVHLKEGIPSQDLDGTDPEVRRLAFTPDDVEQALEAGEAPIMVGKGVLGLPPSAFRGFLAKTQDMQNKDPLRHPAVVAMQSRLAQMKPEGDTLPGGGGPPARPFAKPRFRGDRGQGADQPLDSMPSRPPDFGGKETENYRNMDVLPKAEPSMPVIPGAAQDRGMQVRGLGGPGIGRALRLAQGPGPAADFARQDKMLEGIDTGRIAPSTLGGASREQRQNLTPQDIMRRPSRPTDAPPQPGLLEQFRRRTIG